MIFRAAQRSSGWSTQSPHRCHDVQAHSSLRGPQSQAVRQRARLLPAALHSAPLQHSDGNGGGPGQVSGGNGGGGGQQPGRRRYLLAVLLVRLLAPPP